MNTRRKPARLASGELELLEMLWRIRHATLAEAHAALVRKVGYTTVQTRLNRLVAKGLAKKAGSHPAKYEAVIQPDQVCRRDLDVPVTRVTAAASCRSWPTSCKTANSPMPSCASFARSSTRRNASTAKPN